MKNQKSFAIIGMGRFGRAVAEQLFDMGYEVMALDNNDAIIQNVSNKVTQAVAGDAKDEAVLRGIGIRNYDCVVVAIGDDITDSVLITLLLKELGVKYVVCKAMDINHKKILMKIGADKVVIPEYEMGLKIATQLVSSNILDFIELSEQYGIADIRVPVRWIGKSIKSLDIRRQYGMNVVAVKNSQDFDRVDILPDAEYIFTKDDIVVVIGHDSAINALDSI